MSWKCDDRVVFLKQSWFSIDQFTLSKVLMYQFHYDYVKVKYPGDRSKLLFTDTDSLVYKIRTQNLYQDMLEDK